ncbi:hypothetical protein [Streptomyces sp. NBC_01296]|uniref:hypothetical protein n=1 Tax=Streptomyces sp. NBC_01296 TaxID=2903816 RepID=UPI002E14201D|nr:hypothetical protein OG299_08770 [Streptomyces sp. NBC_01296]WSW62816.1 hypothetical protein OG513_31895 [Streptomyces sp. NBC_00998]
MARAKKAEAPTLDRDEWEYLTYAPGHKCSACSRTVKPLDPVRRGAVDRTSGAPAVVYRHNECPTTQTVAA